MPSATRVRAILSEPVCIVGTGPAGLITAHTLIEDGFRNVQILTRDESVGGVWAKERLCPGLMSNNVHGEFEFSSLPMPPPKQAGGRLSGADISAYMESFADRFLKGNIRFRVEVLNLRRVMDEETSKSKWVVKVQDKKMSKVEELTYSRVILCTGGCSAPAVPRALSPNLAQSLGFPGLVVHSSQLKQKLEEIKDKVGPKGSGLGDDGYAGRVVVIGGGKSAQDAATCLANEGREVTMIFDKTDAFLAFSNPLPAYIRRSRVLSILSPHITLRSKLEQFLHTTWIGSNIIHFVWTQIMNTAFSAARLPPTSPLRNTYSLFWDVRTNDEGVRRFKGFHDSVNAGKIKIINAARVVGYTAQISDGYEQERGDEGGVVYIQKGRPGAQTDANDLRATVVILATGYESSWKDLFDIPTMADLGIGRRPPSSKDKYQSEWDNYTTLANPPVTSQGGEQWSSSIYRGLVPARNILKRDFAVNGAFFTTNNGYTREVSAHWISSYFLQDSMRLPNSVEQALEETTRYAAWMRKRYPTALTMINESYSSGIAFWTWPQAMDELLEDMNCVSWRSCGSSWSWPFKVIEVEEIKHLGKERQAKRRRAQAASNSTTA
ncbi:FAD/NAD(P)-binding domain-containing protein [Pluteus cervinus]|uniref:FAD/NAD(P)-binding domain-containing protein n=1 Tax=Pluteus cervinus TaxID=181527 RepID=A0ACD3A2W4_9AGAR|nr:FAD/NAD(P)-binding domain-containing protein [Pluteus cervinus]